MNLLQTLARIPTRRRLLALAALTVLAAGFSRHYRMWRRAVSRVALTYSDKCSLTARILQALPVLSAPYRTPLLLSFSPLLHTAFAGVRSRPSFVYDREIVTADDGGTIAMDWLKSQGTSGVPIVVILPGVNGCSNAPYVRHAASAIRSKGWHCCVINHRGMGGVPITSPKLYSATMTSDVRHVVNLLDKRRAVSGDSMPIIAVGYSLGGIILTKYLGEEGKGIPIQAAAAFSHPCDLGRANELIPKSFDKTIVTLLNLLKNRFTAAFPDHPLTKRSKEVGMVTSVYEFDTNYTAPMHGYASAEEYYDAGNIKHFIDDIEVPTLVVIAEDDPLVDPAVIPHDQCKTKDGILLVTTEHGGHVAWAEGGVMPSRHKSWMDRLLTEYIHAHVTELKQGGAVAPGVHAQPLVS